MTTCNSGRTAAGADPLLCAPLHLDDFRGTALGQVSAGYRRERRISREAFADLIGVTTDDLDQLEAGGAAGLSLPGAWAIADILGVDLVELLHETKWRVQELAAWRWMDEAMAGQLAS